MTDKITEISNIWRADCRRWGIEPWLAAALFAAPLAGALVLAGLAAWRQMFLFLVNEDGPLEWSQFFVWWAAALFALLVAWHLAVSRRWVFALLWLFLGIACFGAGGEEISWGQRVFSLETPDRLSEANEQEEITIHNLSSVHSLFRLTMMFAGIYGSVLALGVRWADRRRHDGVVDLLFPPLFLTASFLVLAGYRSARIFFFPDPGPMISGYGEWAEACLAFGVMAFTLLVLRRQNRSRAIEDRSTDQNSLRVA